MSTKKQISATSQAKVVVAGSNTKVPHITEELIRYLESIYPDKAPDIKWSDREVWLHRGEVGVVRHLSTILANQKEQMLTSGLT